MNIAYRWFIGHDIDTPVPHFATLSCAFATRFTSEVFEEIFAWILEGAVRKGLVKPQTSYIDDDTWAAAQPAGTATGNTRATLPSARYDRSWPNAPTAKATRRLYRSIFGASTLSWRKTSGIRPRAMRTIQGEARQ